jgi:hypothetical protein
MSAQPQNSPKRFWGLTEAHMVYAMYWLQLLFGFAMVAVAVVTVLGYIRPVDIMLNTAPTMLVVVAVTTILGALSAPFREHAIVSLFFTIIIYTNFSVLLLFLITETFSEELWSFFGSLILMAIAFQLFCFRLTKIIAKEMYAAD